MPIRTKITPPRKICYLPHGISEDKFFPINELHPQYKEMNEFTRSFLNGFSPSFVLFYNSRNVRRKMVGDIILSYKVFCDMLPKKESEKCLLIMHTQPVDENGTDLPAVIDAVCPDYKIMFSTKQIFPKELNYFYNYSDVTINISCLPAGTKIATKNKFVNIEDIKINDFVLTHTGKYKKVIKTFENFNKECEMVRIYPFNINVPIELTAEHLVLCVKKKEMKNPLINENMSIKQYIRWVKAKDVEKSDVVMLPNISNDELKYNNVIFDLSKYIKSNCVRGEWKVGKKYINFNNQINHKIKRNIKLNADLAYLLGRWCGDGSNMCIAFDKKYGKEEPIKLGKIYKKYFGGDYHIREILGKNCYILTMIGTSQRILKSFFKDLCGDNSHTKKIPDEIFYNKNINILKSFMDGLYDSDGVRYTKNKFDKKIISSSEYLEMQLIYALIRLNKNVKTGYENPSGYGYKIEQKRPIYDFRYNETYESGKKENGSSRGWHKDNYYAMSVRKIEHYNYTGMVYNIEVETDNSYVTKSLIVHNSNEGWGLSTTESMMAGTPIIVNVTGGLQDQVRFEDENGKWIDFDINFSTNHAATYKKHGEWAFPIFPSNRALFGSPMTPFIFDDRAQFEDVAKKIYEVYSLDKEERSRRGLLGREWVISDESMMSTKKMGENFIKFMNHTLENWKPRHRFELIDTNDADFSPKPNGIMLTEDTQKLIKITQTDEAK